MALIETSLVKNVENELKIYKRDPHSFEQKINVAIVHEWLSTYAGSEKVTESIVRLYRNSSLFSTVNFLKEETKTRMLGSIIPKTTFIQNLPFSKAHFRYYLPLFPLAIRSHNLEGHELIISSSHAFAHGVRKKEGQVHICYCHTPMRYIWDLQDLYLEANNMNKGIISIASKMLAKLLRRWDFRISKDVDYYISNSKYTADRIKRCYGREAKVIYPPVDVNKFIAESKKEDFYLTASRLVCYKKTDLIVDAFTKMPDKKLIVIGDGKLKAKVAKMATPNITFLSHLDFEKFHYYMRKAKAFVFAGEEDFGITMVEAQACGTPVLAYNKGGAAEIVRDEQTGLLFNEQKAHSIVDVVKRFEKISYLFSASAIRENADRFSQDVFDEEFTKFIKKSISEQPST